MLDVKYEHFKFFYVILHEFEYELWVMFSKQISSVRGQNEEVLFSWEDLLFLCHLCPLRCTISKFFILLKKTVLTRPTKTGKIAQNWGVRHIIQLHRQSYWVMRFSLNNEHWDVLAGGWLHRWWEFSEYHLDNRHAIFEGAWLFWPNGRQINQLVSCLGESTLMFCKESHYIVIT